MTVKIILNPYANRWGAQAKAEQVRQAMNAVDLPFDLVITTEPLEGIALAETAAHEGYDAVIAAGGDGTINEVINGVLRATGEGPTIPFGILPLGSANDFNRMAGLPDTIVEAAQVIKKGQTRLIDAGLVNDRYFINNSAIAMEPTVTLESLKIHRVSGEMRYVLALLRALASLKAWHLNVLWDGGSFEGPAFLLSICSSPRTGGFTMAPGAEIDDGRLDMVLLPEVSKPRFLQLLLALTQGKHTEADEVIYTRITAVTVTSNPGTPVHADGEVFSRSATTIHYSTLPQKVTLICDGQ
jgi:diacylglycerol kinase (ATP)